MATLDMGAAASVAAPSDEDLEIERQCYDMRHVMRLRAEGKPFQTHLNDRGLLKSSPNEFCPATKMMRQYLERIKRDVEREIGTRLKTMPLDQALDNEELVWWWGIDDEGVLRLVTDWFAHVHHFNAENEPFITPASWLLKWRPPVPFDLRRSPLSMLPYQLVGHIVDGKDWPPVAAASSQSIQKRAA